MISSRNVPCEGDASARSDNEVPGTSGTCSRSGQMGFGDGRGGRACQDCPLATSVGIYKPFLAIPYRPEAAVTLYMVT